MYCEKCGRQINGNERFCTSCAENITVKFDGDPNFNSAESKIKDEFDRYCANTFEQDNMQDQKTVPLAPTHQEYINPNIPIKNQSTDKQKILLITAAALVLVLIIILSAVFYRHNKYMNTFSNTFEAKNEFVMEMAKGEDRFIEISKIEKNPFKSKTNSQMGKYKIEKDKSVNVSLSDGSYFFDLYDGNQHIARYKAEISPFSPNGYVLLEDNFVEVNDEKTPESTAPSTTKPTTAGGVTVKPEITNYVINPITNRTTKSTTKPTTKRTTNRTTTTTTTKKKVNLISDSEIKRLLVEANNLAVGWGRFGLEVPFSRNYETIEVDGERYNLVDSSEYKTLDSIKGSFSEYFTEDYYTSGDFSQNLNLLYKMNGGKLYGWSRMGVNKYTYNVDYFALDVLTRTETLCVFDVECVYNINNSSNSMNKTSRYTLEKINGVWKFSEFDADIIMYHEDYINWAD